MTDRRRLGRALALLAIFPAVALFAPVLATSRPWIVGRSGEVIVAAPVPFDPNGVDLDRRLLPPGSRHWLGTDDLGRDVLSRLLHGARISVGAGLLASALALLIGTLLGATAGAGSRGLDRAVLFVIEVTQSLPPLVLVAAGAAFFEPSFLVAALLIAVAGWPEAARIVRSEARRVSLAPFVEAARVAGASRPRILFRHVLPHAVPPVLAVAPYFLGAAVLTEAALSFLGLGTPPPTPSWGRALADARGTLTEAWWCVLPPAAALLLLVLSARRAGEAASAARMTP